MLQKLCFPFKQFTTHSTTVRFQNEMVKQFQRCILFWIIIAVIKTKLRKTLFNFKHFVAHSTSIGSHNETVYVVIKCWMISIMLLFRLAWSYTLSRWNILNNFCSKTLSPLSFWWSVHIMLNFLREALPSHLCVLWNNSLTHNISSERVFRWSSWSTSRVKASLHDSNLYDFPLTCFSIWTWRLALSINT